MKLLRQWSSVSLNLRETSGLKFHNEGVEMTTCLSDHPLMFLCFSISPASAVALGFMAALETYDGCIESLTES